MKTKKNQLMWFLKLLIVTLIFTGCQDEDNEIIPIQQNNKISYENFNNLKELKNAIQELKTSAKSNLAGKAANNNEFKVIKDKAVYVHKEKGKTTYTIAIQQQNKIDFGFSNLVVEFHKERVEKAFILHYKPTTKYLNEYLKDPLASFEGEVSLEPIANNEVITGLQSRSTLTCKGVKITYCNYGGKEHLAGPECTPSKMYDKTFKTCAFTPNYISVAPSETESPGGNGGGTNSGSGGNGVATNPITTTPCEDSGSVGEVAEVGLPNSAGNCITSPIRSYNSAKFLDLVNNLPSAQRLYLDDIRNIQIRRDLEDFFRKEAYSQEAKIKVEATISILPTLEELKNYWPKNAEEWKVFGELVVEAMIAIIPDLIPGISELNSLKNSISAFKSGSYLEGSAELGSAIIGIIPAGKVLKAGSKLITLIKTSVTVFKKVKPFIGPLFKVLKKGFKIKIENGLLYLKNKAGKIVAKGDGAVKKYLDIIGVQGRKNWNGLENILKATTKEIQEAASKIAKYRQATGNLKGGNYGYLEGVIKGAEVDPKMWRSGKANLNTEPQIFKAIEVKGASGSSWLRNTDSEYKMLNQLASDLGAVSGGKYPDIEGAIKIVSENPYCASCSGVIQQFGEMFPNVKLILVDGAK